MSLPAPLMFTVGLIDQITRPIAKISQGLSGLASNYQAGTMQMASGIGGIAASGYGLYQALQPALEIDKALGDARGVGVADSALKKITNTAMDFSLQFGQSSIDVINHAAKLRGVLGEMPDHVLASATKSSAVLAMAMKSDAETTSKYFKTLYGNYGGQANAMGQDKFIAQIAGMTAYAKKTLGTEMSDLEGMIDGMHSLPSTLGVALEEQFAVLATLNKSMGQGDAVTQYTNFLEGVAGAQEKLGVKLTDSKGNLLPMIDVIEKLKPMMQGMSGIQARTFLDDAGLGDGSLMIINMMKNLDGLKSTIQGFKNVNGLDPALDMAKNMTSQSERLAQSWWVIRAAIGSVLLPAFNTVVGKIAEMGGSVLWFTNMFPNITRMMGYLAVTIFGVIALGGVFTAMMGAWKLVTVAWNVVAGLTVWIWKSIIMQMTLANLRFAIYKGLIYSVIAITKLWQGAQWALNLAMNANPLGLMIVAVAAIIAGVAALIYYWDDFTKMVADTAWIQAIVGVFDNVWNSVKAMFNDTINWIIDKLNLIPGVDISSNITAGSMPSVDAISPVQANLTRGGVSQQIANANNSKSTTVGNINIYPQKVDTNFANYVEMHS
ncbi:phage tail tape measure protein [Shewanella sp. WE21]|uniref:phage tail tape measure protein n=1 Tax=Shewanella sp. WE21 TaxID=2029986 RepID=UPI000CF66BBA|nr:phage tail tape measure protein [Shewanella sp. WE21]AVI68303.1 phage tail tape measure protein [Shewanella sp. WE21]